MAEREFSAFISAVKELHGPEQAQLSAVEWMSACRSGLAIHYFQLVEPTTPSISRLQEVLQSARTLLSNHHFDVSNLQSRT